MKIEQLYTYPIKSLRPCPIPSSPLTPHGFPYDRRFMLLKVHPSPHKPNAPSTLENMLVATFTEMVLFHQSLRHSSSTHQEQTPHDATDTAFDEVQITYHPPTSPPPSFPGATPSEISIPLRPSVSGLAQVPISLHNSPTTGYDMGDLYNDWFATCFGYEVVLVYLGPSLRDVLGNLSPSLLSDARVLTGQEEGGGKEKGSEKEKSWLGSIAASVPSLGLGSWLGSGDGKENGVAEDEGEGPAKITFADCSAYLVVTTESLADVSARLPGGEEMDVTKFRPNIVLSGSGAAWEEDFWGTLEFLRSSDEGLEEEKSEEGEAARLLLTANCARCVSINIDYDTGRPGKGEAGSMLKKLMGDRRVDGGSKWSPIFGRYGFLDWRKGECEEKWPVVRVGDEVVVGKRNEERTVWQWPGLGSNSGRAAS